MPMRNAGGIFKMRETPTKCGRVGRSVIRDSDVDFACTVGGNSFGLESGCRRIRTNTVGPLDRALFLPVVNVD